MGVTGWQAVVAVVRDIAQPREVGQGLSTLPRIASHLRHPLVVLSFLPFQFLLSPLPLQVTAAVSITVRTASMAENMFNAGTSLIQTC